MPEIFKRKRAPLEATSFVVGDDLKWEPIVDTCVEQFCDKGRINALQRSCYFILNCYISSIYLCDISRSVIFTDKEGSLATHDVHLAFHRVFAAKNGAEGNLAKIIERTVNNRAGSRPAARCDVELCRVGLRAVVYDSSIIHNDLTPNYISMAEQREKRVALHHG